MLVAWTPIAAQLQHHAGTMDHFWVAGNLIMKARLSAKLFRWKLVLFAYELKLIFIIKTLHFASLS